MARTQKTDGTDAANPTAQTTTERTAPATPAGIVARSGTTWVNGKMICPFCKKPLTVKGSHTETREERGKKIHTIVRNCRCTGNGGGAPHTFKHVETIVH